MSFTVYSYTHSCTFPYLWMVCSYPLLIFLLGCWGFVSSNAKMGEMIGVHSFLPGVVPGEPVHNFLLLSSSLKGFCLSSLPFNPVSFSYFLLLAAKESWSKSTFISGEMKLGWPSANLIRMILRGDPQITFWILMNQILQIQVMLFMGRL